MHFHYERLISNGFVFIFQDSQINEPVDGLTTVEFATSVPMVTYLACFIVCDFEKTSGKVNDEIDFSVYASPQQVKYTDYALQAGINITSFFIEYFDINYPLPKLGKLL